jgi:hypothetical protein
MRSAVAGRYVGVQLGSMGVQLGLQGDMSQFAEAYGSGAGTSGQQREVPP